MGFNRKTAQNTTVVIRSMYANHTLRKGEKSWSF